MSRTVRGWSVFGAALAVALVVMVFLTVKMLDFERSMAAAQADAALEETVRLALWRLDSAAAVLLQDSPLTETFASNQNDTLPQQAAVQRLEPEFQNKISQQEYQQRQSFNFIPVANWQGIEPMLLDRIRDILPGASLAPAPEIKENDGSVPEDTRRLATIPARLIVPASARPDASLPWNTPLRISLMIAWGGILLAAAAIGRLTWGTMALSERRGAFASAVTHELRTPLTTFRMYSEMLADGTISEPEARRQYLQTLVTEADRLGHLIENVMAYSRLENRLAPRVLESATVGNLVESALPMLRRRAQQAGLPLRVELDAAAESAACRTDPVAVQQILMNLMDNACKHGRSPVTLTARVLPDRAQIAVEDEGPGLVPRGRHAFLAFNKSKTDPVPGIGLGLYLSRQLARNFGGDLDFGGGGPGGRGARFVLTLPRA